MALYAKYFKGLILDTETSLPEKLDVYACNNENNIIVMVINKENKSQVAEVILEENRQSQNAISFFHNFPGFSLTCIKIPFDYKNDLGEYWEYGERQIDRIIDNNSSL